MLNRRQFLTRSLQGTSLLAVGAVVPEFIARTAQAAEPGKDTILVVVELTGGNDGLNTVIPYTDDLYYKARPTLAIKKDQVVRINDTIGLHPALRPLQHDQLAVLQGVGYPNPDHSHFESMDIWQSADPTRRMTNGWIGRSVAELHDKIGSVPVIQVGASRLPLALQGAQGGAVSINSKQSYRLETGGDPAQQKERRQLIDNLAKEDDNGPDEEMLQFVRRRELQTYSTLDRIQAVLDKNVQNQPRSFRAGDTNGLQLKLDLVSRLIEQGLGTRVYYVTVDGSFDTHARQADDHQQLLAQLAQGLTTFFNNLKQTGHDKRVLAMTFSEFGRRVNENGSKGTDHGSGSCMFVYGPSVKAGLVTKHPSLDDLDSGDVRWSTDFRRVYATLLDRWLACDSKVVLGGTQYEHLDFVKKA